MSNTDLHRKTLLVLLVLVSIAFLGILLPYYGAVFWAVILAIVFSPMQRRLQLRFKGRKNLAALTTLGTCLLIAILPVIVVGALLVQEGAAIYKQIETGQLDITAYVIHFKAELPMWVQHLLERMGVGNLDGLREKISQAAMNGGQFLAGQAFSVSQGTLEFVVGGGVMLYLLFFLLRDGQDIGRMVRTAIPLDEDHKRLLQIKFNRVVRATVKGNLLVAVAQGALGGLIFWLLDIPSALLWAVLMMFLSLLPAVGAGIVWGPVAVWFAMNGQYVQALVLTLFGIFVIGLVDNLLRPLLVGKDTRMPDYLVLISTLGGLALFGLNGFVIGPLVAALFLACWSIFSETRHSPSLPG